MPRLTDTDYQRIRSILRTNWLDGHASWFQLLRATEQWDLHAFYAPTREYTEEQALQHRKVISRENPSLPQRAGKALRRVEQFVPCRPTDTLVPAPVSTKRRIRAHAVVRPEVDTFKLLRFLEQVADREVERNSAS